MNILKKCLYNIKKKKNKQLLIYFIYKLLIII